MARTTMTLTERLHQAVTLRDAKSVRALIKKGVDVEATEDGVTPFMRSAAQADAATMALLLNAGAYIDEVGPVSGLAGETNALSMLCKRARYHRDDENLYRGAINLLLDRGADVLVPDSAGKLPAFLLLEGARPEGAVDPEWDKFVFRALERMISMGVTPDHVDNRQNTLLHVAALAGASGSIVQMLIDAGWAPSGKAGAGFLPVHYASNALNAEPLETLLRNGAGINDLDGEDRNGAFFFRSLEVAQRAIDAGMLIDRQDNIGRTPLLAHIRRTENGTTTVPHAVSALLGAGARLDLADHDGNTPTSLAKTKELHAVSAAISSTAARRAISDIVRNAANIAPEKQVRAGH